MAPPRAVHQCPSEVIKLCLSAESCSSSTVDLLIETLSPKSSTSSLAASRSRNSRQAAAKTSARARPAATSNCGGVGLSMAERSRLAVEVINATLRSLSDTTKAAKSPSRQETRQEASPKGGLKPRKTDRPSTKVLQSRSSNRNDSPSQTPDSVDYLTSCCSIAISFLISIESSDGVPDMIPLQTENARLSLSSKLIQLERFEAAMQELKMLKRRLQLLMQLAGSIESWVVEGNETKNAHCEILGKPRAKLKAPGKKNTTELDTKPEKEDPSKLLEFATISPSSSIFPLVISCQLATMRCISGLKRPDLIEVIISSDVPGHVLIESDSVYYRRSHPKAALLRL
jgi:separase